MKRHLDEIIAEACEAELSEPVPTARLRARVEEDLAAKRVPMHDLSPWQIAFAHWRIGAAFVVLAIAVVAGTAILPPENKPPVETADRVGMRVQQRPTRLESETTRHLERTQLLLRSIRNAEAGAVFDMAYERELSRELLSRNRLLRRSAEQKAQRREEELLNDIEPLLIDIAHLPAQPAADEMRSLRELIQRQHIIAELQLYAAGKNLF